MNSTSKTTRGCRLTMLLLVAGIVIGPLAIAQGERHEFRLEYREKIEWGQRSPYFSPTEPRLGWDSATASRPEMGGGEMLGGGIMIGSNSAVTLTWDESRRFLFANLNRNEDLTDDAPIEVARVGADPAAVPLCVLHVPAGDGSNGGRGRIELIPRKGGTGGWEQARVTSGWEGDIELSGRRWRLSVYDDLDGDLTGREDALALRPLDGKSNSTGRLRIPERLGLAGHLYELSFRFESGEAEGLVVASFLEIEVPTVPCEFSDEHLVSAVLEREGEDDPSTAIVLHRPLGSVPVPEGSYSCLVGWNVVGSPTPLLALDWLDVIAGGDNAMPSRGPLGHHLEVTRNGARSLEVEYFFMQGDGEKYGGGAIDSKIPTFSVYRGREKIASGEFRPG